MKKFGNLYFNENGEVFLSNGERYPEFERRYDKHGEMDGYMYVRVHGKRMPVHRIIAKLFVENPDPEKFKIVDHINRIRSDSRACNLRWVNNHLNSLNRDTITAKFDRDINMWYSSIWCRGQEFFLGFFTTFQQCHKATRFARLKLFDCVYTNETEGDEDFYSR